MDYYDVNNNQQPQKAPNFFKQLGYSFVPPQYGVLAKVKTGRMIGFVVLLTLIATIISFAGLAIDLATSDDLDKFLDGLPDFEVRNGRFSIDEEFIYDEDDTFVYLTDEFDEFIYEDAKYLKDLGYDFILLASRDNISIMQNGEYQEYDYSDLGSGLVLNKDWIITQLVPIIWVCVAVVYIFFFVGRTFWYFLCATIYFLCALLIGLIMSKKVSAGAMFRVAVYSKVLMFVVALLIDLMPFVSFSISGILRTVITLVFMGFAIWKLPDNC